MEDASLSLGTGSHNLDLDVLLSRQLHPKSMGKVNSLNFDSRIRLYMGTVHLSFEGWKCYGHYFTQHRCIAQCHRANPKQTRRLSSCQTLLLQSQTPPDLCFILFPRLRKPITNTHGLGWAGFHISSWVERKIKLKLNTQQKGIKKGDNKNPISL